MKVKEANSYLQELKIYYKLTPEEQKAINNVTALIEKVFEPHQRIENLLNLKLDTIKLINEDLLACTKI